MKNTKLDDSSAMLKVALGYYYGSKLMFEHHDFREDGTSPLIFPILNNICTAIELIFKSFILIKMDNQEYSSFEKTLKCYGHDIDRLYERAMADGFQIPNVENPKKMIDSLKSAYFQNKLRYFYGSDDVKVPFDRQSLKIILAIVFVAYGFASSEVSLAKSLDTSP